MVDGFSTRHISKEDILEQTGAWKGDGERILRREIRQVCCLRDRWSTGFVSSLTTQYRSALNISSLDYPSDEIGSIHDSMAVGYDLKVVNVTNMNKPDFNTYLCMSGDSDVHTVSTGRRCTVHYIRESRKQGEWISIANKPEHYLFVAVGFFRGRSKFTLERTMKMLDIYYQLNLQDDWGQNNCKRSQDEQCILLLAYLKVHVQCNALDVCVNDLTCLK